MSRAYVGPSQTLARRVDVTITTVIRVWTT